jgi:hypothetical protein
MSNHRILNTGYVAAAIFIASVLAVAFIFWNWKVGRTEYVAPGLAVSLAAGLASAWKVDEGHEGKVFWFGFMFLVAFVAASWWIISPIRSNQ